MRSAVESLRLGVDVDDASPLWDLAKTPLAADVLSKAGLVFRDHVLAEKANDEFRQLQDRISQSIRNEKSGFLVEVSVFVAKDSGAAVIPGGQLLFPIGLGIEPVDALAEFMRQPQLRAPLPQSGLYDNNTFYYWIGRQDGNLKARVVPREFLGRMQDAAHTEANQRDLDAAWERAWPDENFKSIVRANYWTEVYRERADRLKTAAHQNEVREQTEKMNSLQADFNMMYTEYQKIDRGIRMQQDYLGTLDKFASLSS